uniref:Pco083605 n=1 Tax=Arundo donax TaxID=35708 RepID=A0A0A9DM07_ARUDO
MSMSSAMDARVLIQFYLRKIVCSSYAVNSVDRQGLLLPSRLDLLLKLVVGRPEHKAKFCIIYPMYCLMV